MAFEIAREELQPLEVQKAKLLEDIGYLGKKVEEAQAQLSEFDIDANALAEVKEDLEKASADLEDLARQVSGKQSELVRLENEVEAKEQGLKAVSEELASLAAGHEEQKQSYLDTLAALDGQLRAKKADLGSMEDVLANVKSELESTKNALVEGLAQAKEQAEQMVRANDQLKALEAELSLKAKRSLGLDEDIQKKQVEITDLISQAEELKESARAAIQERHQAEQALEAHRLQVVEKLEAREGDLSIREARLEEKAVALREAKAELEKHFNRSLKNIII